MTNRTANEKLVEKLASTKAALENLPKPETFADAMFIAQQQMPNKIEGSGNNPHFKSDHITFEQLVLVATEILPELGLRFRQKAHVLENNDVGIETIISGFGEEESYGIVPMKASTSSPHASAGNVTYAKRYSLALALNISHGKDDDGLSAEIETRQKQIAAKTASVEPREDDFKLFSGETCIASYLDVHSFLEGCRKMISKTSDLNCKAIYDSSKAEVDKAIAFCAERTPAEGQEPADKTEQQLLKTLNGLQTMKRAYEAKS